MARFACAEAEVPFDHILIVEPAISADNPSFGIVIPDASRAYGTANVAAGPHNHTGSIVDGDPVMMSDLFVSVIGCSAYRRGGATQPRAVPG